MDDSNFLTQLALYISTPSAAQFTNQNNRPWYGNISNWNVTAVTNMAGAFQIIHRSMMILQVGTLVT